MGGASTPPAPLPVPQNLRLAAAQNPDSITVEWDALPSSPDYEVSVYTPDDVWVSLGGTMGGTSREYGVSDGMVYGATYSFRVRSTLDFVTFSDWSTPLYGVAAPLQTLYYINQGSGLWDDADNWFEDEAGATPHEAVPTASYNCVILVDNTVAEIPISGYNSVTNNGLVTVNLGTVIVNANGATVGNNSGTVGTNDGTVTTNNSGDGPGSANYGTIATNNGTVTLNGGTVEYNNGTVTDNNGTVNDNYGSVTSNCGTVVNDYGYVGPCS